MVSPHPRPTVGFEGLWEERGGVSGPTFNQLVWRYCVVYYVGVPFGGCFTRI